MSIFNHLLVPLDLSENRQALEIAKQIARENSARVTLFHTVETIGDLEDKETLAFYEKLKQTSTSKIATIAKEFHDSDIQVDCHVTIGKPSTEIVRFSLEEQVDLIVMTSHRVTPDYTKGWGTLSYQVSLLCQCPVLLVK